MQAGRRFRYSPLQLPLFLRTPSEQEGDPLGMRHQLRRWVLGSSPAVTE